MRVHELFETPIEHNPENPMNPLIRGHQSVNPAHLNSRMMQAASQLQELAERAKLAGTSALQWESITRFFPELAMNIEQVRHGIEELVKAREAGTTGIDKRIG